MNTSNTLPIFDGHNDVLSRLYFSEQGESRTFFQRGDKGHIDLPRAHEGGFGGGFFAIFTKTDPSVPYSADSVTTDDGYETPYPPALDITYAQRVTLAMMGLLFRLEKESSGQMRVIHTVDELSTCLHKGVLAAILHFEGAEAIDPDLDVLEVFYRAGLRSLGLVWSRANAFAYGVHFKYPHSPDTGPGLTDAGRKLVRACNRLGILIDLSHLNEQGFWDVANLSDAPLVATHSNAHAICSSTRNLTNKQLDAIKESKGMVGVNFARCFLREDGQDIDTPLESIVHHINYLVEYLGIDHVGLGSDFDGAPIPEELGDVAGLPKLLAALRNHGYGDAELQKLTHKNWLRILEQTWHS
jgi:membrane dipeptidase